MQSEPQTWRLGNAPILFLIFLISDVSSDRLFSSSSRDHVFSDGQGDILVGGQLKYVEIRFPILTKSLGVS